MINLHVHFCVNLNTVSSLSHKAVIYANSAHVDNKILNLSAGTRSIINNQQRMILFIITHRALASFSI